MDTLHLTLDHIMYIAFMSKRDEVTCHGILD